MGWTSGFPENKKQNKTKQKKKTKKKKQKPQMRIETRCTVGVLSYESAHISFIFRHWLLLYTVVQWHNVGQCAIPSPETRCLPKKVW